MTVLIKLLFNGIVVIPGLLWSGTSLTFAIMTAVLLALFSYLVGDLYILPNTNNTFASTADFILSFAFLWAAVSLFRQPFILAGLFITSFVLSVGEYFYHRYLQSHGVHHSKHPG